MVRTPTLPIFLLLLLLLLCLPYVDPLSYCINGNGVQVCTSDRFAGAVDSVKWNDKEFVNSVDHGREIQYAITNGLSECWNPTEAGSQGDAGKQTSTSVLLNVSTAGDVLGTTCNPAFWVPPGQISGVVKCKAVNTSPVSGYIMRKNVSIGVGNQSTALDFRFSVTIPRNETYLQIEAPTGYHGAEFGNFWKVDMTLGGVSAVVAGEPASEQFKPVVFATEDGQYAIGAILVHAHRGDVYYVRVRFESAKVYKWSIVWRTYERVQAGTVLKFRSFVCVGTLKSVSDCLFELGQNYGYMKGKYVKPRGTKRR